MTTLGPLDTLHRLQRLVSSLDSRITHAPESLLLNDGVTTHLCTVGEWMEILGCVQRLAPQPAATPKRQAVLRPAKPATNIGNVIPFRKREDDGSPGHS